MLHVVKQVKPKLPKFIWFKIIFLANQEFCYGYEIISNLNLDVDLIMYYAAKCGNLLLIKKAVELGCCNYNLGLNTACQFGQLNAAKFFLEMDLCLDWASYLVIISKNAELIDVLSKQAKFRLDWALIGSCEYNNTEMFNKIFSRIKDVENISKKSISECIICTADFDNIHIFNTLHIYWSPFVDTVEISNFLKLAVKNTSLQIIKALKKLRLAETDEICNMACKYDKVEVLKTYEKKFNCTFGTVLKVCKKGNVEIFDILINKIPAYEYENLFYYCCKNGHLPLVKRVFKLIDKESTKIDIGFVAATKQNYKEIVDYLLKKTVLY